MDFLHSLLLHFCSLNWDSRPLSEHYLLLLLLPLYPQISFWHTGSSAVIASFFCLSEKLPQGLKTFITALSIYSVSSWLPALKHRPLSTGKSALEMDLNTMLHSPMPLLWFCCSNSAAFAQLAPSFSGNTVISVRGPSTFHHFTR